MSLPPNSSQIENAAKKIHVLVLDVDGVMTDGCITYLPGGAEGKTFHVRDSLGVKMLVANRLRVAIISGRESSVVTRHARELGVDPVLQGIDDKLGALLEVQNRLDCPRDAIAYIGDDLPDIPLLTEVGLGFAVADAAPEVRAAADVVLRSGGGHGAVREACELVLRAHGAYNV